MQQVQQSSNAVALRDDITALASSLDGIMINGIECRNMENNFLRVFSVGQCMENLRQALSPDVLRNYIMPLQGSPIGFRTDMDEKGGYAVEVVRDAIIAAAMTGLVPCGNQFNIISSRMYVTKEGFTHLLANMAGLSNLKIKITVGEIHEKEVLVRPKFKDPFTVVERDAEAVAEMSYHFKGEAQEEKLDLLIRANAGMGYDAIVGKAERKAKAWLYATLTGTSLGEGDASDAATYAQPEPRDVTPAKAAPSMRKRAAAPAGGLQAVAAPVQTATTLEPINDEPPTFDDAPPYFPEEEEIGELISQPSGSLFPQGELKAPARLGEDL